MVIFHFPVWLLSLLITPFGIAMGSFANVVIYRLPLDNKADRNIVTKRSHCPNCKLNIKVWHNIPILSWLWLKGKCAYCHWPIPISYPLVEVLTGLLFGSSVWLFPFATLIWLKGLICGYALIILFFTDLNDFFLPDAIQIPLMIIGVLFALPQQIWHSHITSFLDANNTLLEAKTFANNLQIAPVWHDIREPVSLASSLLGLTVGYLVPFSINTVYRWIRKTDGIGMGDLKMLAWLGAFWGYLPMLEILFIGAIIGSIISIPMLVKNKDWQRIMLPLGCLLALSTPIIVFYGPTIWHGYMQIIEQIT